VALEPTESPGTPSVKRALLAERALGDAPGLESRLYLTELAPSAEEPMREISEQISCTSTPHRLSATFSKEASSPRSATDRRR